MDARVNHPASVITHINGVGPEKTTIETTLRISAHNLVKDKLIAKSPDIFVRLDASFSLSIDGLFTVVPVPNGFRVELMA